MSSTPRTGILARLESFDLHPKLVKDFAVRTKTGAAVSICAVLLSAFLFYGELRAYLAVERVEFMEVDPIRGQRLRVNFDVTFPSMPCAVVSLDAMDASGSHQLEIMHDVFKQRIDANGAPIEEGTTKQLGRGTLHSEQQRAKLKEQQIAQGRPHDPPKPVVEDGYCGNCFGASAVGACCNTCEDVREAYRRKGWQFNAKGVEQCEREGFAGDVTSQLTAGEGCNVYGHLEVPKVAGNVHFAPGHGMSVSGWKSVGEVTCLRQKALARKLCYSAFVTITITPLPLSLFRSPSAATRTTWRPQGQAPAAGAAGTTSPT